MVTSTKSTLPHQSPNQLFFGDNLDVMREHLKAESVDLIYLDPPFNSKANYNVLFKSPKGNQSEAQIVAFDDTWHWTQATAREYDDLIKGANTEVAEMMRTLRRFMHETDLLAYLVMMAGRLLELHRVLKPTGSLYLHCDPTASHYLKIVLDGVFGRACYRNEIIWERNKSHNTSNQYGRVHDTILFYTKSGSYTWNSPKTEYSEAMLSRYRKDEEGRLYTGTVLTAPRPDSDSGKFEWRGTMPTKGRGWGYTRKQLEAWWDEGRILCKQDGRPRQDGLKVYLDEMPGKPLQSLWTDIPRIANSSSERLGYPTQKPLALLERILEASSGLGDVVLDPFCGCGTAVHAAQKLGRRWIGIDITHLAISLIEKRLRDGFPGIAFEVEGTPKDFEGARNLALRDKYQFQWWACSLVNAQPFAGKKKGADGGIDGIRYFNDDKGEAKRIIVSVKGGENVSVSMVRDLVGVMQREEAEMGLFVTLAEPTKPMREEAAKAGFYDNAATGRKIARLQLLTIKGLLSGDERVDVVDFSQGASTFKKAQREAKKSRQNSLI